MKCIFVDYHTNGKECDNNYNCADCDTHKEIEVLVKAVVSNSAQNNKAIQSGALKRTPADHHVMPLEVNNV